MAFGSFDESGSGQPMAEMNTTPLIDVMLVLLIMFIMTIPLATHSVEFDVGEGVPVTANANPVRNRLDITPDEYEPFATLSAIDDEGEEVARVRVRPDFRLTNAGAAGWIAGGFPRLGRDEN